MSESLEIYTIYDHPSDHPEYFVVKRQIINGTGHYWDLNYIFASIYLEECRDEMIKLGLCPLPRYPEDDPVIIESWI